MKLKKILLSPAVTILAFLLAVGLLLFSTVGGARAALTYFSETYASRIQLSDIGVTLVENGKSVSWRNYDNQRADGTWDEHTGELLTEMLAEGEEFKLGNPYPEAISVGNSGTINQYVRVSLYRYWEQDGKKVQGLSPEYIDLNLINLGTDWLLDDAATTPERTVLYYSHLLRSGTESAPLSDTLTVTGELKANVSEEALPDGTIKIKYDYDGINFVLEAKVDAVQENNAQAAALSAWGREVVINEGAGTLALP